MRTKHVRGILSGMGPRRRFVNPFYLTLVFAGLVFCITAFAYFVMMVRALRGNLGTDQAAVGRSLMDFLDRRGPWLMMIELAVLVVCAFLAITTDAFWERRAAAIS
ncbi:MAG TPA: hypothetical protein VIY86_12180, partial [Pirellulaceae bacterium]